MASKISLCLLAVIFNLASSSEYTGLLSRLYNKAANENRPLVLVLDNSLKDLEETPRSVKLPTEMRVELDRDVPSNLMELLNHKHHPLKHEHKKSSIDHSLIDELDYEPSYQQNDLERLRYRLLKEKEQRRERRERKERRERRERKNRADDGQDRNDDKNQDRKRERLQNSYHGQGREEDMSKGNEKRVLRTSVIKNLLRTFNDLNCDAKNECEDECNDKFNGKKLDNCENKCEVKYECEEPEKEDPCAEKDACDDESEEAGSTKGERLVTVTEKCKRC